MESIPEGLRVRSGGSPRTIEHLSAGVPCLRESPWRRCQRKAARRKPWERDLELEPENIGGDFNPRVVGQRSNPKRGSGAAAHVRERYSGVRPSGRNPQSLRISTPRRVQPLRARRPTGRAGWENRIFGQSLPKQDTLARAEPLVCGGRPQELEPEATSDSVIHQRPFNQSTINESARGEVSREDPHSGASPPESLSAVLMSEQSNSGG